MRIMTVEYFQYVIIVRLAANKLRGQCHAQRRPIFTSETRSQASISKAEHSDQLGCGNDHHAFKN